MVLFERTRFGRIVIPGITPADGDTLSASLSVPDESGTRLTIERPRPDDRKSLSGEVFHKVGFIHQIKRVAGWTVRYRQWFGGDEGFRKVRIPVTGFDGLLRGLGRRNADAGDAWASAGTRGRLRAGAVGIKVVCLSLINVRSIGKAVSPEVGAVLGGPYWRNVDEFDAGELNGRIERTEVNVIGFQYGGGNVGDRPVIVII